jgi:hypothetical protein
MMAENIGIYERIVESCLVLYLGDCVLFTVSYIYNRLTLRKALARHTYYTSIGRAKNHYEGDLDPFVRVLAPRGATRVVSRFPEGHWQLISISAEP